MASGPLLPVDRPKDGDDPGRCMDAVQHDQSDGAPSQPPSGPGAPLPPLPPLTTMPPPAQQPPPNLPSQHQHQHPQQQYQHQHPQQHPQPQPQAHLQSQQRMHPLSPPSGTAAKLLDGYAPPEGWDELRDAQGELRPHWRGLTGELERLGPAALAGRWEHALRLIRENGVTYNVYGDPQGLDRPWQLDAIPEVIPAREWEGVALGLAQRAHLLDLILADCYGPQRLLREGLLPPAAVFAHPGFLRACHELRVPGGHRLHLYGADLVRGGDGRWRALADRAQAPSGAGYALENRIVLSRALPEAYRECRVQRLASFFVGLRETLVRLAPRNRDNPRIVLLTPGPYNETYFEHAYLARYLGYTLVEGGDLTVRDDCVFLKTLGGLHPVDVVLRRLDDDFCDPLELRNDSTLGVAGLVQAARAGNVAIVNALGSGLAQNPAWMPLLPRLCRHLLGEDLRLESVPSWWCGLDVATTLSHVAANLEHLVIKPISGAGAAGEPVFGNQLSSAAKTALLARIAARPFAYIAQEQVRLSTTPVWTGGGFSPRPMTLRAFAVATRDAYAVMPGALTRIAAAPGARATESRQPQIVSMQRGGGSKDTWVLADGPVPHVTLLRPVGAPVELKRGGIDLPSRVADNLYWLGRYGERAEDTARLLRAGVLRLADDPGSLAGREFGALVRALRQTGHLPAEDEDDDEQDIGARFLALIHDPALPCGLPATLRGLHRAAFAVRDRLSNDTWRIVNHLDQQLGRRAPGAQLGDDLVLLNRVVVELAALAAMGMENTTRGPGWRFLDIGRRLERALFTCDLLRALIADGADHVDAGLEVALDVADSAITYRSRYLTTLQTAPVLDLLLTDATNPRAVAFQLAAIAEHVAALPRAADRALPSTEERLAFGMVARLRLADPQTLAIGEGANVRLATFIDGLANDLGTLSDTIARVYLSHLVSNPAPAATPPAGPGGGEV